MDAFKKAERAIAKISAAQLSAVEIGETITIGTTSFSVSGIKRSKRGYAVSLRSDEGFEWVFPSVKWRKNG